MEKLGEKKLKNFYFSYKILEKYKKKLSIFLLNQR